MEDVGIYTIVLAVVSGVTGTEAWRYFSRKLQYASSEKTGYIQEYKDRIEYLERRVKEEVIEKEKMRATVLDLSVKLATLEAKYDILIQMRYNGDDHKIHVDK